MNWIIELVDGKSETVQCDICGVAQDGSLICFVTNNVQMGQHQNPQPVKGYAPGVWKTFYKSSLRRIH